MAARLPRARTDCGARMPLVSTSGAGCVAQLVVATGSGNLVYLDIGAHAVEEMNSTKLEHEIACVDLSPMRITGAVCRPSHTRRRHWPSRYRQHRDGWVLAGGVRFPHWCGISAAGRHVWLHRTVQQHTPAQRTKAALHYAAQRLGLVDAVGAAQTRRRTSARSACGRRSLCGCCGCHRLSSSQCAASTRRSPTPAIRIGHRRRPAWLHRPRPARARTQVIPRSVLFCMFDDIAYLFCALGPLPVACCMLHLVCRMLHVAVVVRYAARCILFVACCIGARAVRWLGMPESGLAS